MASVRSAPWNQMVRRLLAEDGLTLQELRLAMAIGSETYGWYREEASVGRNRLREAAKLDGRSFDRAVSSLCDRGLLEVVRGSRGRGKRALYRLLSEVPSTLEASNGISSDGFAVAEPARPPAVKRPQRGAQVAPTTAPLQRRVIDTFRAHGGNLEYGDNRPALLRQVKQLAKNGVPESVILAAAAELGRQRAFGGFLKQTADDLIEAGGACQWHGVRSGLSGEQLGECGCRACGEWAAAMTTAGIVA